MMEIEMQDGQVIGRVRGRGRTVSVDPATMTRDVGVRL
jgi:hypothetical protein